MFSFSILDGSDEVSSQEEDTSIMLSITQILLALHKIGAKFSNYGTEFRETWNLQRRASFLSEWTEYDNFPSSEDLCAFLADLELDALNKTKEQSQPIINSKMSARAELLKAWLALTIG